MNLYLVTYLNPGRYSGDSYVIANDPGEAQEKTIKFGLSINNDRPPVVRNIKLIASADELSGAEYFLIL